MNSIQDFHDQEITAEYEKRERMVARVLELEKENDELNRRLI